MTAKRHEAALDRLDASTASALDLFFGAAEPPPAPVVDPASAPDPASEPAVPVSDPPPTRPIRRRERPSTPVKALSVPAEAPTAPLLGPESPEIPVPVSVASGPVSRPSYVPVATGISPVADDRLHRAAYTAGGEREKSRLVREAAGKLLAAFDAAAPSGREELRTLMRRPPVEGRITRIYRLEPETRDRLTLFARDERIPIAAALRAAIERRYGSATEEPSEPDG
jgi:hypothetical protein